MLQLKGATAPFFSRCAPRLRDEALLAHAISAFKSGDYADALLATEYVCRRFPSNSSPAILRAKILQTCRPELAAKAWYRAWLCNPEDPMLQDAMLDAWLKSGAVASVSDLGPVFLPERCRAGTHAPLIQLLWRANTSPVGACWKSGNRIEGILLGSVTGNRLGSANSRLIVTDETCRYEYEIPAAGHRFKLDFPKPSGAWSIAWTSDVTNVLPQLLQGSPLAFGCSPDFATENYTAISSIPVSVLPVSKSVGAQGSLDIIIPVYRNKALVQACIESVLASLPQNQTPSEVIVIDDASPEADLSAWLMTLATAGRITLLRNGFNLGFIGTVNRGLRQHADRDVVLLNADTLVHGDWLDRLGQVLYSASDIASVTPWSNNGEITSFPKIATPSPALGLAQLAQIDRVAAALRRSGRMADVELPSCCGFAMLMRRSVLSQIGLLDEQALVRGYGEEVDWCLRARAAGYRHLAATGVFVAHTGSASFRFEKPLRVRQNRAVIMARYPHYYPEYHRFIQDDPLNAARHTLLTALEQTGLDWLAHAVNLLKEKSDFPSGLPAALASSCSRIAVWQYQSAAKSTAKILALARCIASQPAPALRLLIIGEASEALWHTGVVDVLPPASAHETIFLSDSTLVGMSGCSVLLTDCALVAQSAPYDIVQIMLDDEFQPRAWLADWLSQQTHNLKQEADSHCVTLSQRIAKNTASIKTAIT